MESLHARAKLHHDQLDKELSKYSYLKEFEAKTKVSKVTLVLASIAIFFILIFLNVGGQLITDLVGWLYPAYCSFKVLESSAHKESAQWLTYWTVFGFINVIEFFIDTLLHMFPFWYLFKTVFVLWMILPQFKGAEYLYKNVLRNLLKTAEGPVDRAAANLKSKFATERKEERKEE